MARHLIGEKGQVAATPQGAAVGKQRRKSNVPGQNALLAALPERDRDRFRGRLELVKPDVKEVL
jgi:hypothetical protein